MCFNLAHLAAGEGQLPCLKYLVSAGVNPMHVLGARNDQGETPKDLAQQFYKDVVVEYINGIEWERDHPEEAESKSSHPIDTEKHCSSIYVFRYQQASCSLYVLIATEHVQIDQCLVLYWNNAICLQLIVIFLV